MNKKVKIKQISMKLQINNGEPFHDYVSFYEVDKGYKKWHKSNLQALANKRWAHSPNFSHIRRKIKILQSNVTIKEAGDSWLED